MLKNKQTGKRTNKQTNVTPSMTMDHELVEDAVVKLFIYLASANKKTTHLHKIIRQGDHYSLANQGKWAKNTCRQTSKLTNMVGIKRLYYTQYDHGS